MIASYKCSTYSLLLSYNTLEYQDTHQCLIYYLEGGYIANQYVQGFMDTFVARELVILLAYTSGDCLTGSEILRQLQLL